MDDRKISPEKVMWYSFLDLICCSMGAALLMFLIIASVEEKKYEHKDRLLVVRAKRERGFCGEIGIEFRPPGGITWIRADLSGGSYFSAPSRPSSGGEAFVVISEPESGRWGFRPYLIDYPDAEDDGGDSISVILELFGRETLGCCEIVENPRAQALCLPGDMGKKMVLYVPSSEK